MDALDMLCIPLSNPPRRWCTDTGDKPRLLRSLPFQHP